MTGDHDVFTTNISEADLDQVNETEPEVVTDSQFIDQDMILLIKSSYGQLDQQTFKQEILNCTGVEIPMTHQKLFVLSDKKTGKLVQ